MKYDFIIDRENPGQAHIRVANFVLEWKFNPTDHSGYSEVTPSNQSNVDWYMESCGLIPDFFARAVDEWEIQNGSGCDTDDPRGDRPTLSEIAQRMDAIYQFGGFNRYPWPGTVLEDGTFESPHVEGDDDDEQDPPLIPIVKLIHADERHLECFVYLYGVVTLRDIKTGETKTARFD